MSINHSNDLSKLSLDQSTAHYINESKISSNSLPSNEVFEEQFTILDALKDDKKNVQFPLDNCFAYAVAKTFPIKIRDEVIKMILYYEKNLSQQNRQYHKLVEENNKLQKLNNQYKAQRLANILNKQNGISHQNYALTEMDLNRQAKVTNEYEEKVNNQMRSRLQELQERVISKDLKINELNSQISDLMIKLRKYKKKATESISKN